jgi:phosphoserine phosphatase RsbU/P
MERWLVRPRDPGEQPRRQFLLDFALAIGAGIAAWIFNRIVHDIPPSGGFSFFVGFAALGFFAALDMALCRERRNIREAAVRETHRPPPGRLYPMTRRFFLVSLGTALMMVLIISLVIARDMVWLTNLETEMVSTGKALRIVAVEMAFIMGVLLILVVNLLLSYSRNLKLLFETETGILHRVARGDLSHLVPVATRDEFGVIAGYTNEMIQGLRHRIQLLSSLEVAEEVQRSLLPAGPPRWPGLDLSGASLFCDKVGGDYYDFLELSDGRYGVVVTDAAGHGVGAALHMTTARAFLRFGARDYPGPAALLKIANRFMVEDSGETGRFITLFFLEIDPEHRRLRWVRAGHDPALLYDPDADRFDDLGGRGMALGVMPDARFSEETRDGWTPGSLVTIFTDGVRECRNAAGEMFGGDRLKAAIRSAAGGSADAVRRSIFDALAAFAGDAEREDDATLAVVRLT